MPLQTKAQGHTFDVPRRGDLISGDGGIMPKRVDQYRLNAVKCFELSQTFKDPDAKRTLFAMAGAWLRLATQTGKNTELPASDRCSVPCPRCQSPMAWYSADLTDDRRALRHSYRCEKCGFIRQSDDQRRDIRCGDRSFQMSACRLVSS
jgi:predicted RNA-binding Zn-ribbon protein involved in translation (DUF1610 family)